MCTERSTEDRDRGNTTLPAASSQLLGEIRTGESSKKKHQVPHPHPGTQPMPVSPALLFKRVEGTSNFKVLSGAPALWLTCHSRSVVSSPWELYPLAHCQLDTLVFMTLDALRAHLCRSKWPEPVSLPQHSLPMCSGSSGEPLPDWPSLLRDSSGFIWP